MNANMEIRSVTGSIAEAARENPLGVALLGMGLVWLVGSRTHAPQLPGRALNHTAASLGSAASSVSDMADRATDRATDVTMEAADRATAFTRDTAHEVKRALPSAEAMTEQLRKARERISEAFEQQPLVLAAGSFAIGAAIAATLPAMKIKTESLEKVAETAVGMAATGMAHAVDRVDDAVRAAQAEAQAQASRIADKAGELGTQARDAASEAAASVRAKGASQNALL